MPHERVYANSSGPAGPSTGRVVSSGQADVSRRLEERLIAWRIAVERFEETESSILAFGLRDDQSVVLKVTRTPRDEWRAGEVLRALDGDGTVRVYDHIEGAMLLERLRPGTRLAGLASSGNDDQATAILADVIGRLGPREAPNGTPTVEEWGKAFQRYAVSGDARIPADLVADANRVYLALCRSQSRPRLLHGDLHHDNVLLDDQRGWLAIDPKGVIGELEYEVGAALRNPVDHPSLFVDAERIQKRVAQFVSRLGLDGSRVLAWAFAQAVLSAVWMIEDGSEPGTAFLAFADTIRPAVSVEFHS